MGGALVLGTEQGLAIVLALGIATALLFSLVLVGRLMVVSAELNAALAPQGLAVAAPLGFNNTYALALRAVP